MGLPIYLFQRYPSTQDSSLQTATFVPPPAAQPTFVSSIAAQPTFAPAATAQATFAPPQTTEYIPPVFDGSVPTYAPPPYVTEVPFPTFVPPEAFVPPQPDQSYFQPFNPSGQSAYVPPVFEVPPLFTQPQSDPISQPSHPFNPPFIPPQSSQVSQFAPFQSTVQQTEYVSDYKPFVPPPAEQTPFIPPAQDAFIPPPVGEYSVFVPPSDANVFVPPFVPPETVPFVPPNQAQPSQQPAFQADTDEDEPYEIQSGARCELP